MNDIIRNHRMPLGAEPVIAPTGWPTWGYGPRADEPAMVPQASGGSAAQYRDQPIYDTAGRVVGIEKRTLIRHGSGAEQWVLNRYYRFDDAPEGASEATV